jgi:hypothetical protein
MACERCSDCRLVRIRHARRRRKLSGPAAIPRGLVPGERPAVGNRGCWGGTWRTGCAMQAADCPPGTALRHLRDGRELARLGLSKSGRRLWHRQSGRLRGLFRLRAGRAQSARAARNGRLRSGVSDPASAFLFREQCDHGNNGQHRRHRAWAHQRAMASLRTPGGARGNATVARQQAPLCLGDRLDSARCAAPAV